MGAFLTFFPSLFLWDFGGGRAIEEEKKDGAVVHSSRERRDSNDAQSNSIADWSELRDYRLKVKIFQLGAKIAALRNALL
ncbi:hypothetical protein EYF80_012644 [Liparis tanakae]|uniref:Uncharacterized protein n=1 Tax=Liparis tanakae TaxID=230148 RepID=A0A4Z2IHK9_9TELE|nr:hypothetical protein EYF80_012644 [Liparis tanakae]